MNIAIIGAGLSGLSCAQELKRHGIIPTIFEKRSMIGDSIEFQSILFNMYNLEFWGDPIKHLRKKYNINIKPNSRLNELISVSPNGIQYKTHGKLGYILKRGSNFDSVENQLYTSVNLPVNFDSYIEIDNIAGKFDYIVVATGTGIIPKELGLYQTTFDCFTRVSTVVGNFKTDSITMWWDRKYTKNGYAYLVPYSNKSARLILIVNGITHNELDYYWDVFLKAINIPYEIIEKRDVEHNIGFVDPIQLGNIFFVGVAGGLIDDMFGFAAVNSIISGVKAAQAMIHNKNYDKIMQPLKEDIKKIHEFRTLFNAWDNKTFEKVFKIRGLPVIHQLMYNNPFFKIDQLSLLAKMQNNKLRREKPPQ